MTQPTNPFDDENGQFHVLRNKENQHSLWPTFAAVPSGWDIVLESATRAECLQYVEENWTNIIPLSAQEAIAQARAAQS